MRCQFPRTSAVLAAAGAAFSLAGSPPGETQSDTGTPVQVPANASRSPMEAQLTSLRGLSGVVNWVSSTDKRQLAALPLEQLHLVVGAQIDGEIIAVSCSPSLYVQRCGKLFSIQLSESQQSEARRDLLFLKEKLCPAEGSLIRAEDLPRALMRYTHLLQICKEAQREVPGEIWGNSVRRGDTLEEITAHTSLTQTEIPLSSLLAELTKQGILEPLRKDFSQGPYWCSLGENLWAAVELVQRTDGSVELRLFEESEDNRGLSEVREARTLLSSEQLAQFTGWCAFERKTNGKTADLSAQLSTMLGQFMGSVTFRPIPRSDKKANAGDPLST